MNEHTPLNEELGAIYAIFDYYETFIEMLHSSHSLFFKRWLVYVRMKNFAIRILLKQRKIVKLSMHVEGYYIILSEYFIKYLVYENKFWKISKDSI